MDSRADVAEAATGRVVLLVGFRELLRDALARAVFFAAVRPVRDRERVPPALLGAALRVEARLRAIPRELLRALPFFPAAAREVFREPPRPAFLAFFATFSLPLEPASAGRSGSYNPEFVQASRVARRVSETGPRVLIRPRPGGLTIEIRPLVRSRVWRRRLSAGAAVVIAAALFGMARLVPMWESSLRRGNFSDLPLPVLIFLTLAVGVSAPLTLVGLAALAFAEETVDVGTEELVISTTAFEKTRTTRIPLEDLECWRETYLPLPPWWSWSVKRLAARARGRLFPIAGGAGPKEKTAIGVALARATDRPLVGDFGRVREA